MKNLNLTIFFLFIAHNYFHCNMISNSINKSSEVSELKRAFLPTLKDIDAKFIEYPTFDHPIESNKIYLENRLQAARNKKSYLEILKLENSKNNFRVKSSQTQSFKKNQVKINVRRLPEVINFNKLLSVKMLDCESKDNLIFCISEKDNKILSYLSSIVGYTNLDSPSSLRITITDFGLPAVITKEGDKIAVLKKVSDSDKNYFWEFKDVKFVDISSNFQGDIIGITSKDDKNFPNSIVKVNQNLELTKIMQLSNFEMDNTDKDFKAKLELLSTSLPYYPNSQYSHKVLDFADNKVPSGDNAFTRISVGFEDFYYLVSSNNMLWKCFTKCDILAIDVEDVAVSRKNDLYYCGKNGVFLWERDSLEPRKILNIACSGITVGNKILVQSIYGIMFISNEEVK